MSNRGAKQLLKKDVNHDVCVNIVDNLNSSYYTNNSVIEIFNIIQFCEIKETQKDILKMIKDK